jgi:hypothetical protein
MGLSAALLAACLGCAEREPQERTTPAATEQVQTTLAETEQVLTTREITTILDSSDALVHAIVAGKNYRFPVINLDFPEAARINAEVRAVYEKQIHGLEQGWFLDAQDDFYHTVHGDVLSLIFCRTEDPSYPMYQTYHLNIKTGEPVTNKALLKQAGIAEKELTESLRRKITAYYDTYDFIDYDYWNTFFGGKYDFDFDDYPFGIDDYVSAFRGKTLEELQDIESLRLHWSEQGRLIAVTNLCGLGGALYYEVLVDIAQPDDAYCKYLSELRGNWDMLA